MEFRKSTRLPTYLLGLLLLPSLLLATSIVADTATPTITSNQLGQTKGIKKLQALVSEYRSTGNSQAAVEVQAEIIDKLLAEQNHSKAALTILYYNMGILYFEDGDYLQSKNALEKSLILARSHYGPMHEATINSLTSLGLVLLRGEFLDSALETLYEAQNVMHRSYGVKSVKQEVLLDWMSKIYLEKNLFEAADTLQRLNYETYKSTYGVEHPKTVPAMLKLADWLQRSAQYRDSINIFEHSINVIENNKLSDALLSDALNGIAKTYYLRGKCCAANYLAKAAYKIRDNQAYDLIDKQKAFLQAADMSLFMEDESAGESLYKEAAQFSVSLDKQSKPHLLGISRIDRMILAYRPDLPNRHVPITSADRTKLPPKTSRLVGAPILFCAAEIEMLNKNRDMSQYEIDLDFEVSISGRASNIKVSKSNAPIALNRLFKRLVHHHRFRPAMNNGIPARGNMSLHQTFTSSEQNPESNDFTIGKTATTHGCNVLATI